MKEPNDKGICVMASKYIRNSRGLALTPEWGTPDRTAEDSEHAPLRMTFYDPIDSGRSILGASC